MQNIHFDDGFKTYVLNDDESKIIKVNVTDFGIIDRFEKVRKDLEELADKTTLTQSTDESEMQQTDRIIREKINYIFGSDVSSAAFGSVYCFSPSNGMPVFVNFINAVMPVIEKEMKIETDKMQLNIDKYTSQLPKILQS